MLRFSLYPLVVSLLLPALQVYADNKAIALFDRALMATKSLNYQGVFVLQTGDTLQTIRIFHRHDAQGESLRLVALDGVIKEFIRRNDKFVCILPDGHSSSKHSMIGFGFPDNLMRRLNQAKQYYHIQLGDKARVAGKNTQQLKLVSVDNNRYNYYLWVAEDSGMLLQSYIVDSTGRILRKSVFSLIDVGADIADAVFQPEARGYTHSWNSIKRLHAKLKDKAHDDWHIWLPDGFVLANQDETKAKNGAAVKYSVYSDGLSSISVISEKIRRGHHYLPLSMPSNEGITHAVSDIVSGHFLTVVGEVPAKTVEKIAESIYYEQSP